jgi:hypothetical protein
LLLLLLLVPSEGRLRAGRRAAHGLTANHHRWALLPGHRRLGPIRRRSPRSRPRHVGRTRLPWPRRQCVDHRAVRHRRTRRRAPRRPGPHRRQHRNHRRALDGRVRRRLLRRPLLRVGRRVVVIEGGLHLGVETRWHPRSMTCSTRCAVPRSNDRGPRSPTTPPTTNSAGSTRRSTTPTSGHHGHTQLGWSYNKTACRLTRWWRTWCRAGSAKKSLSARHDRFSPTTR